MFEGATVERSSGMCAPLNSGWLLLSSGLARCGLIGLGPIVGGLHWMGRGCGWRRKGDLMGNRSLLYRCTYRSHGHKEWAIAPRSCSRGARTHGRRPYRSDMSRPCLLASPLRKSEGRMRSDPCFAGGDSDIWTTKDLSKKRKRGEKGGSGRRQGPRSTKDDLIGAKHVPTAHC